MKHNTTQLLSNFTFTILFALSVSSANAQTAYETPPPCPAHNTTTEFCFQVSNEYAANCEKTICMTLTPKEEKRRELGNCILNAEGSHPGDACITLMPDENGCITISHPANELAEWYDVSINIYSPVSQTSAVFYDSFLQNAILHESPYYLPHTGGGCGHNHTTILKTTDGRNFTIKNTFLTSTGG